MKILHLLPMTPYPSNTGGRVRVRYIIEGMCPNNNTTIVALYQDGDHISEIREKFKNTILVKHTKKTAWLDLFYSLLSNLPREITSYRNKKYSSVIDNVLKNDSFDVIFVHTIRMANYIPFAQNKILLVLDQQNLDSDVWHRFMQHDRNPLIRVFARINFRLISAYEKKVLPKFDLIVSCSEDDKQKTERILNGGEKIFYAPNGIDTKYFHSKASIIELKNHLLFMGYLAGRMNEDAIFWFVRDILPLVEKKISGVTLDIVGKGASKKVIGLGKYSNINVLGLVPDVRPYLYRSSVILAPLRLGGGTKIKVLEGMAAGKAMVTTTVGVQGISVRDGEHILIRNNPDTFAEAVTLLLNNPGLRMKMGDKAKEFVNEHHSWDAITNQMYKKILALTEKRK